MIPHPPAPVGDRYSGDVSEECYDLATTTDLTEREHLCLRGWFRTFTLREAPQIHRRIRLTFASLTRWTITVTPSELIAEMQQAVRHGHEPFEFQIAIFTTENPE
jgi:hypothetical protein